MNNEHLTVDEIIDFVSLKTLTPEALELAGRVNAHMANCERCRKRVKNFQDFSEESDLEGVRVVPSDLASALQAASERWAKRAAASLWGRVTAQPANSVGYTVRAPQPAVCRRSMRNATLMIRMRKRGAIRSACVICRDGPSELSCSECKIGKKNSDSLQIRMKKKEG